MALLRQTRAEVLTDAPPQAEPNPRDLAMEGREVEGSLRVFKFPDILQFISSSKRSGVLSLTQDDRKVELALNEGKIINVSSSDRYMNLGQMLVYSGHLTREALDRALKIQEASPTPKFLGEILVEQGLTNIEELKSIIRLQIEEELWELFGWDAGNFKFEQGKARSTGSIEVDLDVAPLHEEAGRRTQEWQNLLKKIPDPTEVFRINPDFPNPLECPLSEKVWRVLSMIDARLSVEALVRVCSVGKFDTYWALDQLLRGDLIARDTPSSEEARARAEAAKSGSAPESGASTTNGNARKSFFGLRWKKPESASPTNGRSGGHHANGTSHGSPQEYATDIGLICAAVNHLLELFECDSSSSAFCKSSLWLTQLWGQLSQRFPRADGIEFRAGRLQPQVYERYAALEGRLSRALSGSHDDGLEALRVFWNKLREKAEQQAAPDRDVKAIIDGIVRRYASAKASISASEFSFERWKDFGIGLVGGRAVPSERPRVRQN